MFFRAYNSVHNSCFFSGILILQKLKSHFAVKLLMPGGNKRSYVLGHRYQIGQFFFQRIIFKPVRWFGNY